MGVGLHNINTYCIHTRKTPMHFLLQDPSPFRLWPHHPPPFTTTADIPTPPGTSPLTLAPPKQCCKLSLGWHVKRAVGLLKCFNF